MTDYQELHNIMLSCIGIVPDSMHDLIVNLLVATSAKYTILYWGNTCDILGKNKTIAMTTFM